MRVLVTGAGGVYGEAILRSLRDSALRPYLVAADCMPHASGSYLADRSYLLPRVRDAAFSPRFSEICRQEKIDVAFIASGAEVPVVSLLRDELASRSGAFLIVNSPELLAVTEDKWHTHRFLVEHGLATPPSTLARDPEELAAFARNVGFPIVAKPRVGNSSEGLKICHDLAALQRAMAGDGMLAQRSVGRSDEEFTVGVLGTEEGAILGSITLLRDLTPQGGRTVYAEVVDDPAITEYAEKLVSLLKPRGYCNVQLRREQGQPVAFEINGRVSSSTGFRATAGFLEAEILLRHYLLREEIPRYVPKPLRMVRVYQELILP